MALQQCICCATPALQDASQNCSHQVIGVCLYVRLEIEAQEQALEQLEKSTQEATRRAHDAEQKAKSALDALKVCLSHKLDLPSLAHVDHKHLFHPDCGSVL